MNHVLCGLAANPVLPAELVDRLIAVADPDIAQDLAGREDLGRAQVLALVSRVPECAVRLVHEGRLTEADIDPVTRPDAALALLGEGGGDPRWARLLAGDPDRVRREKLAACPRLPPDVVEALVADTDVGVVAELALWAGQDATVRLAAHPHTEVRRAVAANEATPPVLLAALLTGAGLPAARRCPVCDQEEIPFAHDRECPRPDCDLPPGARCGGSHESAVHEIQEAALRNPATPAEAVAGFVDHPSALLRWVLAARPGLSSEVTARLVADPLPGVREDLAANPAADGTVLRALSGDPSAQVRRAVAHHPDVPLDVLLQVAGKTRVGPTLLPRIATASPAEVEELARSSDPAARMLLAQRRDLPARIRDALAADADARVAKPLATDPGLSEGQLHAMVDRHGSRVAAKVAANPNTPATLLEAITRHGKAARKALREVARHPRATATALLACLADEQGRIRAAGHPALPPQVLLELLDDADWQVVEAAAGNPSLPRAAMEDLVNRLSPEPGSPSSHS
ncbi:hypothetical protein [Streptomyces sp. MH60]|uniref:hypothetical protein n=1 Tax=Streptomyces sp. MH60 TaxID=1940758 RepID=UPI000CEDE5EE|nr:hypothetical protein [Streptomyces sp. MH60]